MIKHSYLYDVIRGKEKGLIPAFLRFCFLILSFAFQGVVCVRNFLYDRKIFSSKSPDALFVISIGNIVAGGTGKTPVTIMLAQEFINKIPLAILSRGYKAAAEKQTKPLLLSDGTGIKLSAELAGDEPYLIAQTVPKAIVIVGKDRPRAANMAFEMGAELLICDDAMQHRKLYRDSEVVIINALDPLGQGYFLPRGLLRDSPYSLRRADLVVINHVISMEHFESLKKHLSGYTNAPMIGTQLVIKEVKNERSENVSLKGKRVAIFCGIAHPENFRKTVMDTGAKIVTEQAFPDHETFSEKGLLDFAGAAQKENADFLLCTEKDFVKLKVLSSLALPIAYLKMDLKITAGKDVWEKYIEKIFDQISSKKSYGCEKIKG